MIRVAYGSFWRAAFSRAVPAAALGFFLFGYGGILLSRTGQSVAIIWPATVFGLCMTLRFARTARQQAIMLAALFAAGLAANGFAGSPPLLNLGYSLVNIADIAVGLAVVRQLGIPRAFQLRKGLVFGLAAGLLPALAGGVLAGLVVWLAGGEDTIAAGRNWCFANLLGFLMLFPFAMAVSWRQLTKLDLAHRIPEALLVSFIVVATAVLVFRLGDYPLQFLVFLSVIIASTRFRLMGAGMALCVIAVIALSSPSAFATFDPVTRIQMLQLFLGVCSVVGVRIATVLGERDLHVAVIERRRRRAVRVSRFKSQLLSHVSHEVRSPLSAIVGFSAMLESGSLSAERAPEFAAIIAHNGELLRRLHDDLLDLSSAEAGALSILAEPVPVASSLRQCVSAIRLDASLGGKDVLIENIEEALSVMADPFRLAQILNNLIANAYKYGDNFSPIRLRARRVDGYGRIEVINAGPGIPPQEHDAVFRPFTRAAGAGRRVPGAGLGLSIAKLLVEAQGGRIDFESVPGRQTAFWIDLPLAA
jgi:signal transduction histidine kinase